MRGTTCGERGSSAASISKRSSRVGAGRGGWAAYRFGGAGGGATGSFSRARLLRVLEPEDPEELPAALLSIHTPAAREHKRARFW